ncbi:MAG: hypothetical protein GF410_05295 [Chitinivibrionales bacterium]|nr:hypothetical protein [Chitinivibrionales bacterium]
MIVFSIAVQAKAHDKLVVRYFGSSTCGECLEVKRVLLKPLARQYPGQIELATHDIDTDEGLALLLKLEDEYGVTESAAQELFLPDTFLIGYDAIMTHGRDLILSRMQSHAAGTGRLPDAGSVNLVRFLKDRSRTWGFFLGTLATGLADGVNPCAIATMIFLISFLAMQKRKRSEVLVIGLAYTGTVYLTYFAMGLGLKEVIQRLSGYDIISQVIRWGAFAAAAVVALYSFHDAFVYARTGRTQDIKLQLPKAVKVQIHKVISANLGGAGLIIGSVVTGFLVTLLEAICTGQMYLPYIVAMTRHGELRIRGLLYLAFYNFLFVLPLLIVMILAYYGLQWNELAKKTQKNMVVLKVLLGLVMTGLAVYLVLAG